MDQYGPYGPRYRQPRVHILKNFIDLYGPHRENMDPKGRGYRTKSIWCPYSRPRVPTVHIGFLSNVHFNGMDLISTGGTSQLFSNFPFANFNFSM